MTSVMWIFTFVILGTSVIYSQSLKYDLYLCAWPDQTAYTINCEEGTLINILDVQMQQSENLDCKKPPRNSSCNPRIPMLPNHIFHIQVMTRCHKQRMCSLVGTNPVRDWGWSCELNSTMRNLQVVGFQCSPVSDYPAQGTVSNSSVARIPVVNPDDGPTSSIPRSSTTAAEASARANHLSGPEDLLGISHIVVGVIGGLILLILVGLFIGIIFLYRRGIFPLKFLPSCCGLISCHKKLTKCCSTCTKKSQSTVELGISTLRKANNRGCSCPKYACKCPESAPAQKILLCLKRKTAPAGEHIAGAVSTLVSKVHGLRARPQEMPPPPTPRVNKEDIFVIPNQYVESQEVSNIVEDAKATDSSPLGMPGKRGLKVQSMPSLHKNGKSWESGVSAKSKASVRSISSFNDEDYLSDFDSEFGEVDDDTYAAPGEIAPRPPPKTLTEEMEYAFCKIKKVQNMPPLEEIYANCLPMAFASPSYGTLLRAKNPEYQEPLKDSDILTCVEQLEGIEKC